MFNFSKGAVALTVLMGTMSAMAAPLELRSDSKTIRTKARSIEAEYSRDMRRENAIQSYDLTPHQGALVIEEAAPAVVVPADEVQSYPGETNTYYSASPVSSSFAYASNLKMRDDRKAGVGVSAGGTLGALGFNMELNFEDADGVVAGFGTGPGYNSVQLAWKHSFEGEFLTPYTALGYSRWYNSRGRTTDYSSSNILDRVLTADEKREGRFGTDFVNASLGLQYNQLTGDFAGLSFFGELTAMYEVKRTMLLPNGSVGALYFF